MKTKPFRRVLGVVAAVALATGSLQSVSADDVHIAGNMPLTGPIAAYSGNYFKGFQMGLEDACAAHGVDCGQFKLGRPGQCRRSVPGGLRRPEAAPGLALGDGLRGHCRVDRDLADRRQGGDPPFHRRVRSLHHHQGSGPAARPAEPEGRGAALDPHGRQGQAQAGLRAHPELRVDQFAVHRDHRAADCAAGHRVRARGVRTWAPRTTTPWC